MVGKKIIQQSDSKNLVRSKLPNYVGMESYRDKYFACKVLVSFEENRRISNLQGNEGERCGSFERCLLDVTVFR